MHIPGPARAVGALSVALTVCLVVAACGAGAVTPTPAAVPSGASPSPAASSVLGAGSPSPEVTPPDLGVSPDRTLPPGQAIWPASVISATIALAAVDKEFGEAVGDWQAGAQRQDMELLVSAAQGMAMLADGSVVNAQRLADFPELAPVGRSLVDAYTVIQAAGLRVAETAQAGDTAGFEAAVKDLGAGMAAYALAREPMVDAAELALIMRRGMLVK